MGRWSDWSKIIEMVKGENGQIVESIGIGRSIGSVGGVSEGLEGKEEEVS